MKPTTVGFKTGQRHVLFLSYCSSHVCVCVCTHVHVPAGTRQPESCGPNSMLFQEREAQRMTPAKRQAEEISLANSGFTALPNKESHEYQ